MENFCIQSQHINKIAHPIKEIRQRALCSLFSKLEYGLMFDDELNRSKQLLGLLFKWFEYDDTDFQDKALKIMLTVLKSSSGNVLIRHFGHKMLMKDLNKIKEKIDPRFSKHFQDIIHYLATKNTSIEEDSLLIPELEIPPNFESNVIEKDLSSSYSSQKSYTREDGSSRVAVDSNPNLLWSCLDGTKTFDLSSQGIKIYLMPWCQLCETDASTISMIEDAIISSVEKTTRFFIDILLKDFPPELFLNRPKIVQHLYKMLNILETSVLSMEALFALCYALNRRIHQLYDPHLRHCKKSTYHEMEYNSQTSHGSGNLEHLFSQGHNELGEPMINCGDALSQLPLPLFCLDTIYLVINTLGQGVSTTEQNDTLFSMKEMNIAVSLCFEASKILQKILTIDLWKDHHSNNFTQQIAQKIVMVLRSLGDVLNRFRISFSTSEMADSSYRITYLRLLSFGTTLAKWCHNTPLVPATFTSSLYDSLPDVCCFLLYPKLHKTLKSFISVLEFSNFEDQKKFATFSDAEKLCFAMSTSVNLLQNYDTLCNSPKVIQFLRDSLPALEVHKNTNFFNFVIDVFCVKMIGWKQVPSVMDDVRFITLTLMAHGCQWVQEMFYSVIHDVVIQVLGGVIQTKDSSAIRDEASLSFLLHPAILIEICSQGLESESKKVNFFAKEIIQHLLKGKLLLSDRGWSKLLDALMPALPYLHIHGAHDEAFGQSVIKTLDLKIGQCMLIPKIDMIMGNVRLLFTKCFTAQMEGSLNLTKLLSLQEDSDNLLPKHDSMRPDILCAMVRTMSPNNFNIIKHGDPSFYEKGSLLQVMSLLRVTQPSPRTSTRPMNLSTGAGDAPDVDPSFRRSALAQLAVMLQQPTLHETFLSNNGCKTIMHYLRASLTTYEYTCFPESAMSCVSILNSLCYSNASIRQWLSEQQDIVLNILRALYLFPNEESFSITVSQLLCLLSFSQVTINLGSGDITGDDISSELSLPHCINKRTNLPFKCGSYCRISPHRREHKIDLLMSDSSLSNYLRIYWCTEWYGGVDKVLRWPYVPDSSATNREDFSSVLMMTSADLAILKASSPVQGCVSALYQIQNASSHKAVNKALDSLNGYLLLTSDSGQGMSGVDDLPWGTTFSRFLSSSPASPNDSSLLLNVTKCLSNFLEALIKNDCNDFSSASWIIESITDTSRGIASLLKHSDWDSNWVDGVDQTPNRLRQNIIRLIGNCCQFCQRQAKDSSEIYRTQALDGELHIPWAILTDHLTDCLAEVDVFNYYSLAYVGQMVKCLTHLTYIQNKEPCKDSHGGLIRHMAHFLSVSFVGSNYIGYKGLALVQNCFIILCHLLENSLGDNKKMQFWLDNSLNNPEDDNVLSACLLWYKSSHLLVRTLSFKILSGLSTQPAIVLNIREKFEDSDSNVMEMVVYKVIDLTEASIFREQAAILLSNILLSKTVRNNGMDLLCSDFYEKIAATVTKVCLNESEEFEAGDNIPLDILTNREKLEVAHSKNELTIPIKLVVNSAPKCSVQLLTALTDVIFNILLYYDDISDGMEKSGIFRILFRCIALKSENTEVKFVMITAICRMLHKAVNMSSEVQTLLVNTEDCVCSLLNIFSSEYTVLRIGSTSKMNTALQEMWKWGFLLIGSLSEIRNGFICIWNLLSESGMLSFFQILLLSLGDQDYKGICSSAVFCLVKLLSGCVRYTEDDKSMNIKSVLDKTLTSSVCKGRETTSRSDNNKNEFPIMGILKKTSKRDNEFTKFNTYDRDLSIPISMDSVLSEDLCSTLLYLYKTLNIGKNINSTVKDNDGYFVITGLSSLFAVSEAAKLYAVNSGFIQDQIELLQEMQYAMSTDLKALDILQHRGGHPVMNCLDWTLQLLCNLMTNCSEAKELCASNNLVVPLNKLWPWCTSTSQIRFHTLQMLCVYTNDCPKANQSMHITIGLRSILVEVLELIGKEMGLVSRKHSLITLRCCLQVLENVSSHVHCRAVILKSDIFTHLNKLHPAVTKRQGQWKEVEAMWENFTSTITRYPEGQLKVAEYMGVLCALVHQANCLMLSVLRNCTFNPLNRPRLLGSAELLNLFSTILAAETLLSDKLVVCGALWSLGANHHKSKLSLRTAGLTAKLMDFLHRLKYTSSGSYEDERAIQIVTYVTKVISIT